MICGNIFRGFGVDKNSMDASVGLTFSLQLFQRYRRNGILQASIRHMPGVQGARIAYIQLIAGSVTACYLEDKHGQRTTVSIESLCQVDHDWGPFEWVFQPQSAPVRSQTSSLFPAGLPPDPSSGPPDTDLLIPRVVASLRMDQFKHWTPEQRMLLQQVWQYIDGKRTIQDMKAGLPYPPQVVQDVVQILLTASLIVLVS